MELSKFLVAYRINDDYWWTLSLGDAQVLFDAAVERMETAEAQLDAVRTALGGYKDSDLASLATTIAARLAVVEAELEQTREYVDGLLGNTDPAEPLVDRVGHLVLTANYNTKPAACAAGNHYTNDVGRGYDFNY